MIVQLPDGERRELNNLLSVGEKCVVVENILNEFEDYILKTWGSQSTIYFLNGLSNYLVWHKDEDVKYKHDKEILSKRKTILLKKYDDKNIQFSILTKAEKSMLGIDTEEEEWS